MGKGEGTRRAEGRGHPIVRGDGSEVLVVEVVQLTNKKVDVVRGECVVLLQIIESDERESSREIPPKNMKGRAGVLGRANDMHHRGVKREHWRDMNLNYDQGVVMYFRTPLKVMECTDKEGGSSKASV